MALIYCSACGKQMSAGARACPHCGHPGTASRGGLFALRHIIPVLGALTALAGAALAATKPTEEQLRAAIWAKGVELNPDVTPEGTPLLTNHLAGIYFLAHNKGFFHYHDFIFWSEIGYRTRGMDREVLFALGRAGQIWVTPPE
jgi:hypothetical protein